MKRVLIALVLGTALLTLRQAGFAEGTGEVRPGVSPNEPVTAKVIQGESVKAGAAGEVSRVSFWARAGVPNRGASLAFLVLSLFCMTGMGRLGSMARDPRRRR